MSDLRCSVAKLTTLIVPWTAADLANLSQASLSRTKAYLANLANQGVVAPGTGLDEWKAGPKAREWRALPSSKGPTYGNSAEYRRQRMILDDLKLRDWQARRAGAKDQTDAQAASHAKLATLTSKDLQGCTPTPKDVQNDDMRTTLRLDEAAEAIGCCVQTVRNLIAAGKLKAYTLADGRGLRITVKEVEAFQKRNEVKI